MEFLAQKFENTAEGLRQKEAFTKQVAAQGYRVLSEQVKANSKDGRQGCAALMLRPFSVSAGTIPGAIVVTYARNTLFCASCGSGVLPADRSCATCKTELSEATTLTDGKSARRIVEFKKEAAQRTADINKRIEELSRLLTDSLAQDHHFDWGSLKQEFTALQPQPPILCEQPSKSALLHLLEMIPIIETLFPSVREKRIAWQAAKEQNERYNETAAAQHSLHLQEWLQLRNAFDQEQMEQVEHNKRLSLEKDPKTLLRYWDIVLQRSQYPDEFPRSHCLEYAADEQRLIVDFTLPPISFLPHVGEVKYNPVRNILEEVHVSDVWLRETYDELVVQIALRTIYELFDSDVVDALSTVLFRGHVQTPGKFAEEAIDHVVVSVEVSKAEFAPLNLAQVDPLTCFRRLGGVLSGSPALGERLER